MLHKGKDINYDLCGYVVVCQLCESDNFRLTKFMCSESSFTNADVLNVLRTLGFAKNTARTMRFLIKDDVQLSCPQFYIALPALQQLFSISSKMHSESQENERKTRKKQ